jgi:outer membrane scaffolding protein for murein synthesis (MipA/OmpV family)
VSIARLSPAFLAVLLLSSVAHAREEPLWEGGLGVAGVRFPDYRGSSHAQAYALPTPYFVYRGDFFKADRNGMRGVFYKDERVDLHLSLGASLPVDSADNPARAGMPDLRPSVEIGPSLDMTMWRSGDRKLKVDLRFPVRAAFTVESRSRFIGGQFFPHANIDIHEPFGIAGWNLGVLAGPVFTDRRHNRYFYEVAPEFAGADRAAYAAPKGGYAGTELVMGVSKRYPNFWAGAFARYDTLRGASFESSPLVTSKKYVAVGFGVAWIFKESAVRVPVREFGDERR